MRVLYLTKSAPIRDYTISKKLIAQNEQIEEIYAGVFSKKNYLDLIELQKEQNVFSKIYNFVDFIKLNKDKTSYKSLDEMLFHLDKKYSINLNMALTADRYLSTLKEIDAKIRIYYLIIFYESIFNESQIEITIGELSSASDYICYKMCLYFKKKYIFFWHGRISNRIEFLDLEGNRSGLKMNYQKFLSEGLTIDEENLLNAYFMNFFKNSEPDYMKFSRRDSIKNVWRKVNQSSFLKRIGRYLKSYRDDLMFSADLSPNIALKLSNVFLKIFFPLKLIYFKKYYKKLNLYQKFFLLPLHFQPESSTLTFAPFYLNQIEFISNLSKALPGGMYLYVKEHPAMVLNRNLRFYKELMRIKNVRIVSPNYSTKVLLEKCFGVITLTNTTGYEGIIYDKPIFVFGNVFYNIYNYSYKCNSYYDFILNLKQCIESWDELANIRQSDRKAFIISCLKSLETGNVNSVFYDKTFFNEENVESIANSIVKYINNCRNI